MSTADATLGQLDALRGQVRASQHARSFPLLVIGALLLNYAVTAFASQPVAWRYGAPLAFALLWLLGKLTEARSGVGVGRSDFLAVAAFVFAATNLVLLHPVSTHLNLYQLQGIWLAIIGIGVGALAHAHRDRLMVGVGALLVAAGAAIAATTNRDAVLGFYRPGSLPSPGAWPNECIAVIGAVLAGAGLVFYRQERRQA